MMVISTIIGDGLRICATGYVLCIYILCIYYIQTYIVHILHIYLFKYRRLDSDPDAVGKMIYPRITNE